MNSDQKSLQLDVFSVARMKWIGLGPIPSGQVSKSKNATTISITLVNSFNHWGQGKMNNKLWTNLAMHVVSASKIKVR